MTSAEVYDLLRVRYYTHKEKLLFKNAIFKIITRTYSAIRRNVHDDLPQKGKKNNLFQQHLFKYWYQDTKLLIF